MGHFIEVDGRTVELAIPEGATAAVAFPAARDRVLQSGRIVTSVRVGTQSVTWNDGSNLWDQPLGERNRLEVASDYPIRVTVPFLERLVESLPKISEEHRARADAMRADPTTTGGGAAELLAVWADLQQAVEQVCALHGIDLTSKEWKATAESFQSLLRKLNRSLKELKESLDLGDMILAADLMEFELAPLAIEWVAPLRRLQVELETRFPAA